jgi:hypothetical protein
MWEQPGEKDFQDLPHSGSLVQNIDVKIYEKIKMKNKNNFLMKNILLLKMEYTQRLIFNFRILIFNILTYILFFFVAVVLITFWISSTFRIPSDLVFRAYGKLLGYVPD